LRVSVVVPVKDCAELLSRLLESLRRQTLQPHEVIVVDDGSTDGSPAVAERYGAKVLSTGGGRGPNFARSIGVRAASGDVIALTDSDCLPSEDWLESLIRELEENPGVGIVAGTTIAANPECFMARFLDSSLLTPTPKYGRRVVMERDFRPGIVVATCNMAVVKRVFERVGLFDPDYRYYGSDDMDFVYRALRGGFRVLCSPRPLVRHYHRTTLTRALKRYFQYGEGFAIFRAKHPESAFSRTVTPAICSLVAALALAVAAAFLCPPASAALLALVLLPFIIHHARVAVRQRRLEALAYPVLDLLVALASAAGFLYMLLKVALGRARLSLYKRLASANHQAAGAANGRR